MKCLRCTVMGSHPAFILASGIFGMKHKGVNDFSRSDSTNSSEADVIQKSPLGSKSKRN